MLDIFSGLRLVVKRRTISIDNAIFRCHWFFTSTLLVSFSLIITARQYVGQPIECHSVNKLPDSLLNSYCWVQSTFTVPQACNKEVGFDVPYPCIDNTRGREIKMFAYYQWVGIVLFIQGLLFHLPYYLWKVWENGLIKAITGGLRIAVLNDQDRIKKKEIVVEYIHDHLGCHKRYAFKYFLCEFICLINLLAQLWGTNKFFDGQFLRYGIDVINYSSSSISGQFGISSLTTTTSNQQQLTSLSESIMTNNNNNHSNSLSIDKSTLLNNIVLKTQSKTFPQQQRIMQASNNNNQVDPMTFIFPRITKCTYYDFGSSGDIQKHDALCLLPLNIINEKIYIALWFWFIILAILTLLVIFYRLFAVVSENVRCKGLISRCKLSSEKDIRIICRHCDVGDWFLFYMVAENLDPLIMREIVSSIANKIRAHFELKRDLGMMADLDSTNEMNDLMYKYKLSTVSTDALLLPQNQNAFGRRASQFQASFDSDDTSYSVQNSRRGSLATTALVDNTTANESAYPFIKKLRKRLNSSRFFLPLNFSSLINTNQASPASSNNRSLSQQQHHQLTYRPSLQQRRDNNTIVEADSRIISSAPPISEMPLNSMPPFQSSIASNNNANQQHLVRRGSLTRTVSGNTSASTADAFVLEMQPISLGSKLELRQTACSTDRPPNGMVRLHRRLSSQGGGSREFDLHSSRPKLIRQRSLNNQSSRDLQSLSDNIENTTRSLMPQQNADIDNLFEEIPILDS